MVFTLFLLVTSLCIIIQPSSAFQLRSSATIPNINKDALHNFLATPTHWPQIVLSSHSVKCPSFATNRID
eukprot:CCRYP_005896-RA/>CCRYP_005896-RA protein AED:0.42 eAED:0.42 QI:90/-1/0/1/-1/0/1/0/69